MTDLIDIHTEITELRAELSGCILTRKERVDAFRRLEDLLAAAAQIRDGEGG
ncbi:hypothetical protein [Xanthobacter versatilis]|uniref:hypothetical protein n=1 Tax=Xanthobacter autotrophicus (strain ATCC BAA-1158 / Py2) TaxID=78245 RepID=UPI003727DE7F